MRIPVSDGNPREFIPKCRCCPNDNFLMLIGGFLADGVR
jgi:hypothetical protein